MMAREEAFTELFMDADSGIDDLSDESDIYEPNSLEETSHEMDNSDGNAW